MAHETDAILVDFAARWTAAATDEPTRALWHALATTPSRHLPLIEAWLFERTHETSPGYFPGGVVARVFMVEK